MTQADRARAFRAMHVKGDPVVLYNIWDAGSARAVADAGARALATGSWSVATAQGYEDGEALPLDFLARIVSRIVATVDLPLTVDFEGGYAEAPAAIEANVGTILRAGAIGVNFEDRVVQGEGLYAVDVQARRIAAVRAAADAAGVPLFINARTDVFLATDRDMHAGRVDAALARGAAYGAAGADGLFVPGLVDPDLIAAVCAKTTLPVNVMFQTGMPSVAVLARLGVARISHGPRPFRQTMAALAARCAEETAPGA
jgi:2-methylisocitrate lyase-like PEP mutase family enzyme